MTSFSSAVERACNTEPGNEDSRRAACGEIVTAINEGKLALLDLAVALAGPLTSPEKEAREHGTRLLSEVVARCRGVLGQGELHTLAEFLSARLRDWPCVGAAAAGCRALLQRQLPPPGAAPEGAAAAAAPAAAATSASALRDDSALLVLEATAEMLRSAQSFRQDDRSALLALLLAAARGWGGLAARGPGGRGVPLLDAFLGAVDGEKDPRCLVAAFEAMRALCSMHHAPGADPAPLRELAAELADWCAAYFPISFNPPPAPRGGGGGGAAITRATLAGGLEAAMAASPFLAAGVVPLLLEKLSSTYRPSKEDALSALRACCPAYGPDALSQHSGQLWAALRSEVMAPCTNGGGGGAAGPAAAAVAPGGGGGGPAEAEAAVSLAEAAAGCLTAVLRAAGPGGMDLAALQDAWLADMLHLVGAAAGQPQTRGSPAPTAASQAAAARADRRVLCASLLLAAVCAAGPASLLAAQAPALVPLQSALHESLSPPYDAYDRIDHTLYGMTVLTAVVDAVAAQLEGGGGAVWLGAAAASGGAVAALGEVRRALTDALAAVQHRLGGDGATGGGGGAAASGGDVSMADAAAAEAELRAASGLSPEAAAQLRLAVVATWRALLRLHAAAAAASGTAAAAAAAATAQLLLSPADATAAAGQLCACALLSGGVAASGAAGSGGGGGASTVACRMRWGTQVDVSADAAAALQSLLRLPPPPHPSQPPTAAEGPTDGTAPQELQPVVQLLVARLSAAMSASSFRAAAGASGSEAGGSGDGVGLAAAALRLAVQLAAAEGAAVDLPAAAAAGAQAAGGGGGSGAFAAAWLESLPPLLLGLEGGSAAREEWLRDCLRALAVSVLPAAARQPTSGPHRVAVAAAAHHLAVAALAAAAEWEVAGAAGLPFSGAAEEEPTASSSGSHSLMEAWCGAVRQLVACCDDKQQLALAMDAAERIADSAAAAASGTAAPPLPQPRAAASLQLACAIVAGLRPPLLAPASTQALADSLLHVLASSAVAAPDGGDSDGALQAAAVALAAVVNRWQDASALDAWLDSAFKPTLLQRLALAPSAAASAAPAAAAVAAARTVGWLGRALALRNHPMLREVVSALLRCVHDGGGADASGSGGGAVAMDVDGRDGGRLDAAAAGAPAAAAPAADAAGPAAMAAADAFGLLVADEAAAGGVSLPAVPSAAVCRVLWQQRTYSLCAQVLSEAATTQQGGDLSLPLAVAVARLAGPAPRQLCGQDAPRLAPLLLRSSLRLSRALGGAGPGRGQSPAASASGPLAAAAPSCSAAHDAAGPAAAAVALAALRGALAVLLGWVKQQQQQQSAAGEQQSPVGKALQDHVTELVDCLCAAAAVGAAARAAVHPGGAASGSAATPSTAATAAVPGLAAAAVREEALRCCTALMDALPYHCLHPLRQQVLAAITGALDDNRRSVRQLAVRGRRVWGDK